MPSWTEMCRSYLSALVGLSALVAGAMIESALIGWALMLAGAPLAWLGTREIVARVQRVMDEGSD